MKNNILFIVGIFSMLSGCSDPDNVIDQDSEKFLSVAEVGFSLKSENGISKSFFEDGDRIGLYVDGLQGTGYNKLVYTNNVWGLETPVVLSENDTYLFATYPYDPQNNGASSFEIEHRTQTDYLYSDRHRVNKDDPELSLTMKHALALIEFEFEPSMITQNEMIDFISIEGYGLHVKAKIDLNSGQMEYLNDYDPAIIYGWQMENPFISYDTKASLMVVPVSKVDYQGAISFNMHIGKSKYYWLVPAGTTWESGKKYTYSVHFQDRELNIWDVRIQDWIDGGSKRIGLPYN